MSERVTLRCHVCEQEFTTEYGPGRFPLYCGDSCRALVRRIRRRIRYVEQLRRMAHVPPF